MTSLGLQLRGYAKKPRTFATSGSADSGDLRVTYLGNDCLMNAERSAHAHFEITRVNGDKVEGIFSGG